jgi:Alginate export
LRKTLLILTTITALIAAPAMGAEITTTDDQVNLSVDGQVRIRFVSDTGKDFLDGSDGYDLFTQRTRLGVNVKVEESFGAYIQLQDVRAWGSEASTLNDFDADGFDLHQGYADIYLSSDITLRSGRQEIGLDNQRLVGTVGWADQARSFDGLHLFKKGEGVNFNLFYTKIEETNTAGAMSAFDRDFYGGRVGFGNDTITASASYFSMIDADALLMATPGELTVNTYGVYIQAHVSGFSAHGEYYMQSGSWDFDAYDLDIDSSMWSAGVGYKAGNFSAYVSHDALAGDDDLGDDEIQVFDTLFATNHKYYGFMDVFTDIPVHTDGLGLQDTKLNITGGDGEKLTCLIDYHIFALSEEDAMDDKDLGSEIDFTVKYKLSRGVLIMGGVSTFEPADAMENMKGDNESEEWHYFMTTFSF